MSPIRRPLDGACCHAGLTALAGKRSHAQTKCAAIPPTRSSVSQRFEGLAAKIAEHLERFRGNMTDAEFDGLVADVVRTAIRFQEIEARALSRSSRALSVPVFKESLRREHGPTIEG